ncbi:hypothetical protein [Ruminococcus sp.]
MVITKIINGCEVRVSFLSKSEDIKDKVLWLILECFKSRINSNLDNSLLESK